MWVSWCEHKCFWQKFTCTKRPQSYLNLFLLTRETETNQSRAIFQNFQMKFTIIQRKAIWHLAILSIKNWIFAKLLRFFCLSFNGTWEFIFQKIRSLIRCVLPTSKPFHPYLHTFRWHCIKKISFLSQFLWWEVNSREHENLFFRKSRP